MQKKKTNFALKIIRASKYVTFSSCNFKTDTYI